MRKTHGKSYNNRLYRIWISMKTRCYNPNFHAYKKYGGVGIEIYKKWRNNFEEFYNWSISNGYKDNLSIDRINPNGNYEPDNCRWADRTIQSRNIRIQSNNKSGFHGVCFNKRLKKYNAVIKVAYKQKHIGTFNTKEEAALARDKFIIENNLNHPLSGLVVE